MSSGLLDPAGTRALSTPRERLPLARYEVAGTHLAAAARWAEREPDRTSVRWWVDGRPQEWTRRDLAAACGRFAAALARAGLARGDRVGIVGPSTPMWLVAALGTQAAGGVTVGAYPTSAPEQLAHVFGHSGCRVVVVHDADLADRVAQVRADLPTVERVLVIDPAGAEAPGAEPLEQFVAEVDLDDVAAAAHFVQAAADADLDDLCTIVYTSGTTGDPKGAVHSYRTIGLVADTVGPAMGYAPDDEYVVYLPLNHTAEQTYTIVLGAQVGWTLNFARSVATLAEDLRAIRPTVMFGVPRIFEKVREALVAGVHESLADAGFDRLRVAVCGGAPLAPDLVAFFHERGVRLCNTYGMTEANAIASSWDRAPRGDTCGVPFPGVDVRLDDDGEILVRSAGLCLGYHRDEEATRAMFTQDGFLRTGDVGRIDADGELRVVDRKKDIIITSGGKNISPSAIEHRLVQQDVVNQAVVVGDGRRYVAAVIELAVDAVRERLGPDGPQSLEAMLGSPEVAALVEAAVAEANRALSGPEQVKRWALLPRPLQPGDPEVTPTMKVRRRRFEERHADLIEGLYR